MIVDRQIAVNYSMLYEKLEHTFASTDLSKRKVYLRLGMNRPYFDRNLKGRSFKVDDMIRICDAVNSIAKDIGLE